MYIYIAVLLVFNLLAICDIYLTPGASRSVQIYSHRITRIYFRNVQYLHSIILG